MFLDETEDDDDPEADLPAIPTEDAGGAGPSDFDANFSRIYSELRGVARGLMASEAPHTLTPTALVHELWVKLRDSVEYRDRPSSSCCPLRRWRAF